MTSSSEKGGVMRVTQQPLEHCWKGRSGQNARASEGCVLRETLLTLNQSDSAPGMWDIKAAEKDILSWKLYSSLTKSNPKALSENRMFLSLLLNLSHTSLGLSQCPFLLFQEEEKSYFIALSPGASCSWTAVRPGRWGSTSRNRWSPRHLRRLFCLATLTTMCVCVCLCVSLCMLKLQTNLLGCKLGIWGCFGEDGTHNSKMTPAAAEVATTALCSLHGDRPASRLSIFFTTLPYINIDFFKLKKYSGVKYINFNSFINLLFRIKSLQNFLKLFLLQLFLSA